MTRRYVVEPSRKIPVAEEVNVAIAGGGPAGIGAAVGATRAGAKVALVERSGCLGGVGSAALMSFFSTPHSYADGIVKEIL